MSDNMNDDDKFESGDLKFTFIEGYHDYGDRTPQLQGKQLHKVLMSDDKEHFAIVTKDGFAVKYRVDGDCCSYSWVEHIDATGTDGGTIVKISEASMGEVKDPDHECLETYEFRVQTSKGDVVVEFRNSSNGYYGGNVSEESGEDLTGLTEVSTQ